MPQAVPKIGEDVSAMMPAIGEDVSHLMGDGAPPEQPEGAIGRFASGAWKNLNPMGLVSAARHPIDTATALLEAHKAQYDKAREAYGQGRYSEAIGHLGAAALPVLGPAAAAAGEKIGEGGDIAGGLGEGAGLIASVFAPRAVKAGVPAIARGVGRVGEAVTGISPTGLAAAGQVLAKDIPVVRRIKPAVKAYQAYQKGAKAGPATKVPPIAEIVDKMSEPETPVLPPGEQPPAGSVTPKQLNEARLAEIRADYQAKTGQPAKTTWFGQTMSQNEAGPLYRAADLEHPIKKTVPIDDLIATNEGFQNEVIQRYRVHPGTEAPSVIESNGRLIVADGHHHILAAKANGATNIEVNVHPVNPELLKKPQPRALWLDSGGRQVAGQAAGHVPLSEAVTAVREAAKAVKPKLTATEFTEATRLTKQGRPAVDVMDAIAVQRALKGQSSFAGLPSDAEVAADMGKRAMSGQKSLMGQYGQKIGAFMKEDTGSARLSADKPVGASGNPFPVTADEMSTVHRYLGNEDDPVGMYIPDGVNGILRGTSRYDNVIDPTPAQRAYYQQHTQNLQRVIEKTPTPKERVFYRGITKKLVDRLKDGTVFTDKGFTSVSTDSNIARERFTGFGEPGGRVYKVRVPKGTPMLDVEKLVNAGNDPMHTSEAEHILGHGTRFRVDGDTLTVLK